MTLQTHAEFLAAVETAKAAAASYYNGTADSPLSDEEFDLLVEQIEAAAAEHGWREGTVLSEAVAAGQAQIANGVPHSPAMLSLAKLKDLDKVVQFATDLDYAVVLEPKIDGNAIALEYRGGRLWRASTRGDGKVGEDITQRLLTCQLVNIPRTVALTDDFEVRGELYLSFSDFAKVNQIRTARGEKPFENPRNIVAGVTRSTADLSYIPLSFGMYDAEGPFNTQTYRQRLNQLQRYGFVAAASLAPKLAAEVSVRERVEEFGEGRAALDVPTDGIVLKADAYHVREELGAANRHPRWAVAYKYEAEVVTSKLLRVVRDIGKSGRITYVGEFEPVQLAGSTVERATLNNAEFIAKHDLRLGDTIYIRKANDIIPEVLGVVPVNRGAKAYVPPTTCPYCGVPLDQASVMWVCHTPACRLVPRIVDALARKNLDADGWSKATVKALAVSNHFTELEDIYKVPKAAYAATVLGRNKKTGTPVRIGEERAEKLWATLQATKQQSLDRVLASLSIPSLGSTTSRLLAREFGSYGAIAAASQEQLAAIYGLGDISAANIVAGLREHAHTFEFFKAAGFTAFQVQATRPKSTALAGKSFAITGSAVEGWSRDELGRAIEALGGRVSSSLSKNTGLLIYGEQNSESKVAKAQQLGVPTQPTAAFIAENSLRKA